MTKMTKTATSETPAFTIETRSASARLRLIGFRAWKSLANTKQLMATGHMLVAAAIADDRLTEDFAMPAVDSDGIVITIETVEEDAADVQQAAAILRAAAAKVGLKDPLMDADRVVQADLLDEDAKPHFCEVGKARELPSGDLVVWLDRETIDTIVGTALAEAGLSSHTHLKIYKALQLRLPTRLTVRAAK